MLYKKSIIFALSLFTNAALADVAYREHEAHQHGVAQLTIALSQQTVEIELHSPAYNILGFEHRPRTKQQLLLVKQQFTKLNQPTDLFLWNTTCDLESTKIDSPFKDNRSISHHEEHEHDNEESSHSDEQAEHQHHDEHVETHGHDHDESAHKHDEHAKAHEHHHDEHDQPEDTHSDIAVQYHYHCQTAPKSVNIKGLFTQFPNFETINAQWVSDTQQSATVLNAGHTQIKFK